MHGESTQATPGSPRNSDCQGWRPSATGWDVRALGVWGGGRCRVFLAKLDLQNAYWSIRLPPAWRSVFVVGGRSGRRFRYARLPFGWAYSPVICQKLVSSVIRGALSRRGVRGWVYLDDILLSCRSKSRLRGAVRDCIRRLRRAGFIVGAKSEPDPTERLGFIGKQIDTKAGTISNAVGALVGAFRAWIRGLGGGRLPSKVMERLLGKLCWLSRPNAGLGAFLAGAYRGLQSGKGVFGRGVCKGVATVLLFSCVPQRCDPPGPGGRGAWEVFVDAAPEGKRFRLGIVGGGDYYRSEVCPWCPCCPWNSASVLIALSRGRGGAGRTWEKNFQRLRRMPYTVYILLHVCSIYLVFQTTMSQRLLSVYFSSPVPPVPQQNAKT